VELPLDQPCPWGIWQRCDEVGGKVSLWEQGDRVSGGLGARVRWKGQRASQTLPPLLGGGARVGVFVRFGDNRPQLSRELTLSQTPGWLGNFWWHKVAVKVGWATGSTIDRLLTFLNCRSSQTAISCPVPTELWVPTALFCGTGGRSRPKQRTTNATCVDLRSQSRKT